MDTQKGHACVWARSRCQHGVISRTELLALGFNPQAIKHRVAKGRLHPVFAGVYAVGRPDLTREGWWMAAVLACGHQAALSHDTAAGLFEIRARDPRVIAVSVPARAHPRCPGIVVHRRRAFDDRLVETHRGIRVTNIVLTLIDLATGHARNEVEAAVNEADKRDLIDPERLRLALDEYRGWRGVPVLRSILDRRTFTLTDSELERRFLPLARKAGLPPPLTQTYVNGFKVDFFWPDLGLVVETDGLRYHRTPAQQARDRRRDQAHAASGITTLRFTHTQVYYEPEHVQATLAAVATRLARNTTR